MHSMIGPLDTESYTQELDPSLRSVKKENFHNIYEKKSNK